MRISVIACALLLAAPISAPAAEICEMVNDVANSWNDIANLLDSDEADGFSESDYEQIGEALGALTEGSATLAGALQGAGNADQVALGEELEAVLSHMAGKVDSGNIQYLADSIDQITRTMDAVTDDCDASQ
ncbi:MAG: hypothetical protein R3F18_07490 [Lysobacterales bacterium]|nr:hypothetical protein [Xanthomonadales bacterium]MCB1610187.1 hypothetical protein [Xanthomonadales bacterium]MCP5473750.1 hypothetical protein [Rhodanobacteraceae bacterium]